MYIKKGRSHMGNPKGPNAVIHRDDGTSEITLTRGKVAIIDTAKYDLVKGYRWCAYFSGWQWYAVTRTGKTILRMHQLLLPLEAPLEPDHFDGDGLNNRIKNLRESTHAQNGFNTRKAAGTSSRFKGVWFHKPTGRWLAGIKVNRKSLHLGYFLTEEAAYRARLEAEKVYYPGFDRFDRIAPG